MIIFAKGISYGKLLHKNFSRGPTPLPLDMLGKKLDEKNSSIFTFLPTSLLWRFILFRMFSDFSDRVDSDASTNCRLNSIPYLTLSLHPPHFQPSTVCSPSRALTSHVHVVKFPAVHACVTECTTPALKIEYINAVSRVPKKRRKRIKHPQINGRVLYPCSLLPRGLTHR